MIYRASTAKYKEKDMNTLKIQVTSYRQPLPGALVRLCGDDAGLASRPMPCSR